MKTHAMSRALEIVLLWALLTTPAASPQMTAQPGKLEISSTPKGAPIIVNGKPRPEVTPVTLVVSPGVYKVVVGSCAEQSVKVSSGETKDVHCP